MTSTISTVITPATARKSRVPRWLAAIIAVVMSVVIVACGGTSSPASQAAPTAAFTAQADSNSSLKYEFDASASTMPGGTIAWYEWSWGAEEGKAEGSYPRAEHRFATPGSHTVTLTVRAAAENGDGPTNMVSQTVTVTVPTTTTATSTVTAAPDSQTVLDGIRDIYTDFQPGELAVGNAVDFTDRTESHGDNDFSHKTLKSQADVAEFLNGGSPESAATKQRVTDAIKAAGYGDDEVARALNGSGFFSIQAKVASQFLGTTYFVDGAAYDAEGWRQADPNDVYWLFMTADGKVVKDAAVRADCGNAKVQQVRPVRAETPWAAPATCARNCVQPLPEQVVVTTEQSQSSCEETNSCGPKPCEETGTCTTPTTAPTTPWTPEGKYVSGQPDGAQTYGYTGGSSGGDVQTFSGRDGQLTSQTAAPAGGGSSGGSADAGHGDSGQGATNTAAAPVTNAPAATVPHTDSPTTNVEAP